MTSNPLLNLLNAGIDHLELRRRWCAYVALGVASAVVAETIDLLEPAPYAAYYAGAVHAAVSPRYWSLLGVISLLLLCLTVPALMLAGRHPALTAAATALRQANAFVLDTAFVIGALAAGMLGAHLLLARFDAPIAMAWSELFLGLPALLAWLLLLAINSGLGGLAQMLTRPKAQLWAPGLAKAGQYPGWYPWAGYLLFVGLVALLVFGQQ